MKKMLVFLLCLLVLCLMAVPGASAADISVRDEFAAHLPGSPARSSCTIPRRRQSISSITTAKQKTVVPLFHLQNLQLAHRPGNRRIGREDVYTLFKWNGTQYSFPTPRSYPGIGHRSRWCGTSEELAARIGPERMQEI